MDRADMLATLDAARAPWDVVVIGGGATGLGVAVDAAARGYHVALFEQADFAAGTSSRSTKLVHGGVRYLKQGNVALVTDALRERGRMRNNAPHLVGDLPFVVPAYDWWEGPFYGIGLKMYDLLAGRHGFGKSEHLSRDETLEHLPTIEPEGLRGGTAYHDGQFDDARLAIALARTAAHHGATLVNYARVTRLHKNAVDVVRGVTVEDLETGEVREVRGRVVVNATGVFADSVRQMDDPDARPMIAPSQGVHIVLDRSFLPGESAIMVPKTDDGRVLFAIPWHDAVVVGTTDTPVETPSLEPRAFDHEVEFLLTHAARYLTRDPAPSDVRSVFAGLRPLVGAGDDTASLSRDHALVVSPTGLVTITGGKWTTYRKMAEDTVDQAALVGGLTERPCPTATLPLHGYYEQAEAFGTLAEYGSDAPGIQSLTREFPELGERLHPDRPELAAEVVWAAQHEMARTVEDVLARRTRALILDARTSLEMAPRVAALLAEHLGRDDAWAAAQIAAYRDLAQGYLLPDGWAPSGTDGPPTAT